MKIVPLLGSLILAAALAAPAEAALVYTKDGRTLDGALRVDAAALVVTGSDGKAQTVPYEQVLGIAFDGQPLFAPPARPAGGQGLKSDLLTWSVVVANLAALAVTGALLYRSVTATPSTTPAQP
jgi:hypothetical protein